MLNEGIKLIEKGCVSNWNSKRILGVKGRALKEWIKGMSGQERHLLEVKQHEDKVRMGKG